MKVLIAPSKDCAEETKYTFRLVAEEMRKICEASAYIEWGAECKEFETLNAILGTDTLICRVTDPNFFIKNVRYGVKGKIAVVGADECCGPTKTMIKNPLFTTSYGVGETVDLARKLNKDKVYVSLGKTSVNDCGAGIVCALGGKFFSGSEEITPVGNTLAEVDSFDLSRFEDNISGREFIVVDDDRSRLTGEDCIRAAAAKGAKGEDLKELERNVSRFLQVVGGEDFDGAGSGGGLGFCFKRFFGAERISFSDLARKEFDIIVTTEGSGFTGDNVIVASDGEDAKEKLKAVIDA